jgi:ribosomal protein S12 methylthiotransferase accessory factor YcaO
VQQLVWEKFRLGRCSGGKRAAVSACGEGANERWVCETSWRVCGRDERRA